MLVGAHRSFAVPSGPVAQKPEAHSALSVQAVPRAGRAQTPPTTL